MEDDYYICDDDYYDDGGNEDSTKQVTAAEMEQNSDGVYERALRVIFEGDTLQSVEPSNVLAMLKICSEEIANLAGVSRQFALLLLRHYSFNRDNATEGFFTTPEKHFKLLNVSEAAARSPNNDFVDLAEAKATHCCPLPLEGDESDVSSDDEDKEDSSRFALSNCGHFYGRGFWCDMVRGRLDQRTSLLTMPCAHYGCKQLVDFWALLALVDSAPATGNDLSDAAATDAGDSAADAGSPLRTLGQLVRRSALSEYIGGNPRLTWCANPNGCGRILYCPLTGAAHSLLMCPACGFPFCGRCNAPAHAPATCAIFTEWQALIAADGASIARILKKTKACPSCGKRIEKYDGCNHMTCNCRYEFCWICLGGWRDHSGDAYHCTAKAPQQTQKETDEGKKNRVFFNHYTSYDAHIVSLRAETKLIDFAQSKVHSICTTQHKLFDNMVAMDDVVAALNAAQGAIRLARLTLAATYIKSWKDDLSEKPVQPLLLHRRGKLMMATEELSRTLSLLWPSKQRLSLAALEQNTTLVKNFADLFYA